MEIKKIFFFVVIILSVSVNAFAANHYIRQGADNTTGNDWIHAYTTIPTTMIRGDLYYVAGNTGGSNYGSKTFNTAASGTNTIEVRKATVSDHGISTGWDDSYASTTAVWTSFAFTTGYWIINGVTGGGPGSWGTGFGFQVASSGANAKNISINSGGSQPNITLEHLDLVSDGYTQLRGSEGGSDRDIIYMLSGTVTNFTITYSYLHDVNRTMILSFPVSIDGVTITYNYFARNRPVEHAEAWSCGSDSNVVVQNNIFEDISTTAQIGCVNGNGTASNWDISGNIFYFTGNITSPAVAGNNSGIIDIRYDGGACAVCITASNWKIYNNVIIGDTSFDSTVNIDNPVSVVCYNNIWYNNHTDVAGCGSSNTRDYNWFYNNRNSANTTNIDSASKGSETNSIIGTSNPFTNWTGADFSLVSAIAGLTLTSPTYNTLDPLGIQRAVDGVWDMGAYEYCSGGCGGGGGSPGSGRTYGARTYPSGGFGSRNFGTRTFP